MAIAGEIPGDGAARFIKMVSGDQSASGGRRNSAFAIVPFFTDFRLGEGAFIYMHLRDFPFEVPSLICIHPDLEGIYVVMVAGVRTSSNGFIVKVELQSVTVAGKNVVVPLPV